MKDVSENFCTVMSVLHKQSKTSARIDGRNDPGTLTWDDLDFKYGTLTEIPTHVVIKKGAKVITSGYTAIFPDGVPIGTVVEYEVLPGDDTYTIKVKFSEDYSDLSHVYIIRNLMREEQIELEKKLED